MQITGYKTYGAGQPVVLLHSSLSTSYQWLALINHIKADYFCINIDLLGYGDAPDVAEPEHYSLKQETDRIIEIVTAEIGLEPFSIVGHSFGGAVALRIAHLMGERLKTMVLYEPVAFHLLDLGSDGFKDIISISAGLSDLQPSAAARTFVDYWNTKGYFDQLPHKIQILFAAKIGKVLLDFKGLIGESYQLSECALSHCPVMVIEGQQSPKSSKAVATLLIEQLPRSHHCIFAGGHMAPIQQSIPVAKLIAEYLNSPL